jgi:hypothetical protein
VADCRMWDGCSSPLILAAVLIPTDTPKRCSSPARPRGRARARAPGIAAVKTRHLEATAAAGDGRKLKNGRMALSDWIGAARLSDRGNLYWRGEPRSEIRRLSLVVECSSSLALAARLRAETSGRIVE